MKRAIITISSKQSIEDEKIESITPGQFYERNGGYYAVYKETEISGMKGTTTTLKIKDGKVILIRTGTTKGKMEFADNHHYMCIYSTQYGDIELQMHTKSVDIDVNANGGEVFIDYSINLDQDMPIFTKMHINIRTMKDDEEEGIK